jgi:hypothetical protein
MHPCVLKVQCHEILDFSFLQNFLKFADIFAAKGEPPVSLTPVANGKIFNQKSFSYFFGHLWVEELPFG